jgi:serine/threonine-protein kinase
MASTDLEPDAQPTGAWASEQATWDFELARPGHVLESLDRSIGTVPRVQLPDTAADDTGGAVTEPPSDAMPAPAERGGRYQLFGEIARGGMGAVLRGRDPDLGRDLAVKVLLESPEGNPPLVRRFVEEAQIGGQLQHPGIVPIYELGAFADRRPYFTMKLVKGRTLSALLSERESPAHDLPRFLSIFEAICQTVAYAHARGVIHRDLKPSNVMVGSFGEVQVMDWGLAKVLKQGGVADEPLAGPAAEESQVSTVRSGSNLDESHAGSIMGTPAYMAPEQAAGESERIDRQADVFGLGSILCAILTGQPAFTGRDAVEIVRKAMRGDTADALTRLEGCGAEAELIAVARDCLAVKPEDRPRDATVVAERITAYLAGVQARVQAAERERAVAVARAVEERRRRKVQLALAASVLALTTLGGLSTSYYLQQRQARAAAGERVIDRVTTLQKQALDQPEEIRRWEVALAAADQADAAGDPNTMAQLAALSKQIHAGLDAARSDKALLDRVVDIRLAFVDDQDGSATDHDYAGAFREAGIDLASLPPAEAGAKLVARPPSVALALATAVDDWAAVRRGKRADLAGAARLSAAARIADPDLRRTELRSALDQPDKTARLTALKALANKANFDELGPISLHLLGTGLSAAGDTTMAEMVLRKAQRRHPRDAWVNYALAGVLTKLNRLDESIRFYTAAQAVLPESAHELAHVLERRGDSDEALEVFRDLKRLRPGDARNLACLGTALHHKGLLREADETYRAAVVAGRDEIRRHPDDALAHTNLGGVLKYLGQLDEAIAEGRTAIRLKPDLVRAHVLLGSALQGQAKFDEAIAEYREAIRLDPDDADAHGALGHALQAKQKLDESVTECRTAIRLRPEIAEHHYNLANALMFLGKLDLAADEFRAAIQRDPNYAEAHCNLGLVLQNQGDHAGAVEMLRKGHDLGSRRPGWRYPSAQWVAEAERELAVAQGRALPAANADAGPGDSDAFAGIHKRAHELAPSKPGEAEPLFRQALDGYRKAQGPDGALTLDLTLDLATLLDRTGRGADAEPLFRSALEQFRKKFGPADPRTAGIMAVLGQSLIQRGEWSSAEPVLRECLAIRERSQPDEWTTFNTRSTLGGSLLGQKKYAEAEALVVEGYEGMKAREDKIPQPGKPRLTEAAERVVKLYEAWGKPEKAAEWRARLPKPADEAKKPDP